MGADGFADFGFGGAGADEEEAGVGDLGFGEALDEPGEIFFASEAGDGPKDGGIGGDAEGVAEIGAARGLEAVNIDAVGDLEEVARGEAVVLGGEAEEGLGGDDHPGGGSGEDEAAGPDAAALEGGGFIGAEAVLDVNGGAELGGEEGKEGVDGAPVVSEEEVGFQLAEDLAEGGGGGPGAAGGGAGEGRPVDGGVDESLGAIVAVDGGDAVAELAGEGVEESGRAGLGATGIEGMEDVEQEGRRGGHGLSGRPPGWIRSRGR